MWAINPFTIIISRKVGSESNASHIRIIPLIDSGLLSIVHFCTKWSFLVCAFLPSFPFAAVYAHTQFCLQVSQEIWERCERHGDQPCLDRRGPLH